MAVVCLLLWTGGAAAQGDAGRSGEDLRVFHVIFGPGDYVWERFGHNAIWIHDPHAATGFVYNWGMFDFRQDDFVLNFIRGRMLYWVGATPLERNVAAYRQADRSITVQELDLFPAQREALHRFLRWNVLPENRHYLYDYFRDNCSTRVRDALDRALGGQLRAQTAHLPANTTYRREALRLLADHPPGYFGIHAGLSSFVDRPISVWDEMFVPMRMQEHLRELEIADPETGERRPLVASEQIVYEAETRPPEREAPPFTLHWFLLAGALLGGAGVLGGARPGGGLRHLLTAAAVLWGLLAGIGGLLLLMFWFTDHVAAHGNANLFQFNPLALGLPVLVPLGLRRRQAAAGAYGLAWGLLALSALGVGVAAIVGQQVAEFVALAFPAYLGIAIGLDLARRREVQE